MSWSMNQRPLVPSGEPLAPAFLVGRLFRNFADETAQLGVPGAIAGKFTVSQKCLWIKELAVAKTGNDAAPAEETCGRSPIIMSHSMLRTPCFC
jgi:hypothetical protein